MAEEKGREPDNVTMKFYLGLCLNAYVFECVCVLVLVCFLKFITIQGRDHYYFVC